MRKAATRKIGDRAAKRKQRGLKTVGVLARDSETGRFLIATVRFEAVMEAAERSGLLKQKNGRIAGRVSPALVEKAKQRTGIKGNTELIAFALASVALEDNFARVFKESRGQKSLPI